MTLPASEIAHGACAQALESAIDTPEEDAAREAYRDAACRKIDALYAAREADPNFDPSAERSAK